MPKPIEALQGVANVNQALPNVVTSGQPGPEQFRALKEAGIEVVIDTRDPMEPRGYDQQALMDELGFDYRVIAVTQGTLTDETLHRVTEAMIETQEKQVLVHCNSGNRVGGALIPYLMLHQDMTAEEATTAALRMGLRSAHLLEWGMAYVRAKQGDEAP